MTDMLSDGQIRVRVDDLLPWVVEGLKELVRSPSVATAGFAAGPVLAAHEAVVGLLRDAGASEVDDLHIEGKTGPVVAARPGSRRARRRC